ncbi:MAG: (deoxy)nucleoside triphosphate pyrophosphohydrolase, partial [Polyangiaceae bacterium]
HRLGVEVAPGSMISFVSHPYERYTIDLYLYECVITSCEPQELNVESFRWVTSSEFDQYPFTPADEASMNALLGLG